MDKDIAFFDDIVEEACKRLGYKTKDDREFVADLFENSISFIKESMKNPDVTEIRVAKVCRFYTSKVKMKSLLEQYGNLKNKNESILKKMEEFKYRLKLIETMPSHRVNKTRAILRIWRRSLNKLGYYSDPRRLFSPGTSFRVFKLVANEQNKINGYNNNKENNKIQNNF